MSDLTVGKQWIQLRMGDSALSGVSVHHEDGDLFSLSKQMLDRSGRLAHQLETFEGQLATLKRELEAWSSDHADSVEEAFLVLKGDNFLFLVVLRGKAYDGALEDALTELDMKIARDSDYNLINLSVMALPAFAEEAIRSFLPYRVEPGSEGGDAE